MKKYCKDCKYFFKFHYPYSLVYGPICDFEKFVKNNKASNITGKNIGHYERFKYEEINKNNKCPYFEKKSFLKRIFE